MTDRTTLTDRVTALIAEIQPILGLHGGSIELVEVTEYRVARLRFLGACVGCAAAELTLNYGVKELLLLKCEDLEDVESVNSEPITHEAPTVPLPFHANT
jgi:Fe-S cluster biogenesis protein NfuA